jgi:hypothetical protein
MQPGWLRRDRYERVDLKRHGGIRVEADRPAIFGELLTITDANDAVNPSHAPVSSR